tara:strand:+ start:381 stop:596 length:216 start_codon:yes stop_codon:yes gene_type:complete
MLTLKQLKLYNFLVKYKKDNSLMPSLREMQRYMEMKSISQVCGMIGRLDWKQYIKKHEGKWRSIEILNKEI